MSVDRPTPEEGGDASNIGIDISMHDASAGPHRGRSRQNDRIVLGFVIAVIALASLFVLAKDQSTRPDRSSEPEQSAPSDLVDQLGSDPLRLLMEPTPTVESSPTQISAPVLGRQSNMWLFYGGSDRLQRLDLDLGVITTVGLGVVPVANIDNELIIMTDSHSSVGWIGLNDLAEQPHGWLPYRLAQPGDDGLVWLYDPVDESWRAFDPLSTRVIERRSAPRQIFPEVRRGEPHLIVSGPDVIGTPGGIYEYQGETYKRVGSGTLLTYTPDLILVESCDQTLDSCVTRWLDRATLTVIDELATPAYRVESAQLVGGGRWLHAIGSGGQSQLFSTEPGSSLEIDVGGRSLTVSPDGTWLAAARSDGTVELTDLATGVTSAPIAPFSMSNGGRLLFVNKDDMNANAPAANN